MRHILPILFGFLLVNCLGCSSFDLKRFDPRQALDLSAQIENVKAQKVDKGGLLQNVDVGRAIEAGGDLTKAVMLDDKELGRIALQFAEHSDANNKVAGPGSLYVKRLAKITGNLKPEGDLKLKFKVYLTPEINAFALADGNIRIFSGIMDLCSDEELLAVIGHEVGHVKLGHVEQAMRLAYTASAARKGIGSLNSRAGTVLGSELIGGMFEDLLNAQFSQSNEEEADTFSAAFLVRNNLDPQAAVQVLEKLARLEEKSGQDSREIRLFARHPASGRRATRLAAEIGKQGSGGVMLAGSHSPAERQTSTPDQAPEAVAAQMEQPLSDEAEARAVLAGVGYNRPAREAVYRWDYFLQLSAVQEPEQADKKVEHLLSVGLQASTRKATVGGIDYYRVLIGPFPDRRRAKAEEERVRSLVVLEEEPFVQKLAGTGGIKTAVLR